MEFTFLGIAIKCDDSNEFKATEYNWGSRDGVVVRVLASHQCGTGSILGLGVICWLSLLLVLVLAPRGFSPGTPVFSSPQKPTIPNSNSIWIIGKHFIMTSGSGDCASTPRVNDIKFDYLIIYYLYLPVVLILHDLTKANLAISPVLNKCIFFFFPFLQLWFKNAQPGTGNYLQRSTVGCREPLGK